MSTNEKKKSGILNWVFIFAVLALTIHLIQKNVDVKEFYSILEKSDVKYFLMGILCVFIYWGLETYMIHSLLRSIYTDIKARVAFKTVMIGQYYSHLTPFASGSQPMQAYYLSKDGVKLSDSSAMLVSKFLLFQITVTVYALVMALTRINIILVDLKQASTFVIIGLSINMVGLVFIIMAAYRPHIITKVLNFIIYILNHVNIIKNPEEKYYAVKTLISDYLECFTHLLKDKIKLIKLFLASLIQVGVFFSIPWFVYLGLGMRGADFIYVNGMAALLYIAVAFIPIPGAAGASEIGFTVILGRIFSGGYMAAGLLLWRGISFYFSFIFCGIYTLGVHIFDRGKKEKLNKVKM